MDVKVRLWLFALTFAVAFTYIVAIRPMRNELLQTHRLEIIGANGEAVAVVGSTPESGGVVLLYDNRGTLRAAIGLTTSDDAAVDLYDRHGNQRVSVQVSKDGVVTVKGLSVVQKRAR